MASYLETTRLELAALLIAFLIVLIWSMRPSKVDRKWRRWRKGQCPGCGYDLRAHTGRCPECGRKVQWKDEPPTG